MYLVFLADEPEVALFDLVDVEGVGAVGDGHEQRQALSGVEQAHLFYGAWSARRTSFAVLDL